MTPAGITYVLSVAFWAATAFYGVLSSQPFVQEQFLTPRLFAPLAAFADWHTAIALGTCAGWIAVRRRMFTVERSLRARAAAIGWLITAAVMAIAAPLSGRLTTAAALSVSAAGALMVVLIAVAECGGIRKAGEHSPSDRSGADLAACCLAALAVTIAHVGAAAWLDGLPSLAASDVLRTLELHLLLASGVFLVLSAVRGAAALTPRTNLAEVLLSSSALAAVLAGFIGSAVLASISIRGLTAAALAAGLAAAFAVAVAAPGTARAAGGDGVVTAFSALSPAAVSRWWGLALWVVALFVAALAAAVGSRTMDWNFVLLRSGVLVTWMLALSAALRVSTKFAAGGAPAAFACVALLLGAHVAVGSLGAPVEAATLHNASGKWISQMLARRAPVPAAGDIIRTLHANTNIPRETPVEAVDVDLAPLSGTPSTTTPNIFLFVIDSLRRDYLEPYNADVRFTPAIAALADDSLVFRNAFTQYGATGLSVPSIWVGGPILHKQYVSSFPRMNTLAKLLTNEQYEQWVSMDRILEAILPPSTGRVTLNAGVQVKNTRLCATLEEIRTRLAGRPAAAPPVFAYALPQDVHVSVVTSEGARPVDGGDYDRFYAPVASRVRRLDQCLGEFITALKAGGLYEQSVIVLTSDHGDSLGEDGRMGHAYSMHPEIVRVPLIIHVPTHLRNKWAWNESRVAYTTDITPTLYRLLGHEPAAPAPFFGDPLARPSGEPLPPDRARMLAASYGAVYGALLDQATRYYVFDAIAMQDMAFEVGDSATPGRQVPVTADVQERGLAVIRETVDAIGSFYGFTAPDSAP